MTASTSDFGVLCVYTLRDSAGRLHSRGFDWVDTRATPLDCALPVRRLGSAATCVPVERVSTDVRGALRAAPELRGQLLNALTLHRWPWWVVEQARAAMEDGG